MTPAPAPRPFPSIRYTAFDALAARAAQSRRIQIVDAVPIDGVWTVPAHIAADALRVPR